MTDALIEFFSAHTTIALTAHLIGVAVGMGGATITDVLFFNFLRDFSISKKEAEVMNILSNLIMGALVLLYLSGIALFLSNPSLYAQSPAFLSKAFIVLVLTLNGILMHKFIAPNMVSLSFLHPYGGHRDMHRWRPLAFAMGAVSFTSWYSVFFIAMLKSYLPPDIRVLQIIVGYMVVLSCAVFASQLLHRYLHGKGVERR